MDDDKQLMKYLSWLDDLDQEYLFHDVENISAVRMDHQDLPGQCSTNNALQYDENVANYDYSTKIMSNYNVNETMMTEALSSTQSNVVSDPYNYNFMQTDNFYSNSVPQQHIPMKSELDNNASAFCIDLSNAVHSDSDSYTHTSDPQLCIDITAGSADLNMQPEQSHYSLTSNVDIKENLFHEEKHIIDDNFTNNQLSSNSIPHHMSNTYTNEFSNMQHQNELYCSQVCQEPSTINDMPTNQNSYAADLHNMNNVSNQSSIQPPIDIHSNFQEALKIETPAMKEEISCQQSEMVQESMTISPSTENIPQVTQTESIKQEDVKTEENCVPENKPTVNGVDKIGIEDEIVHIQMCIRNGCVNRAVNNPEWEQEFCSNECVIIHCRNVFTAWVKGNEMKSQ